MKKCSRACVCALECMALFSRFICQSVLRAYVCALECRTPFFSIYLSKFFARLCLCVGVHNAIFFDLFVKVFCALVFVSQGNTF